MNYNNTHHKADQLRFKAIELMVNISQRTNSPLDFDQVMRMHGCSRMLHCFETIYDVITPDEFSTLQDTIIEANSYGEPGTSGIINSNSLKFGLMDGARNLLLLPVYDNIEFLRHTGTGYRVELCGKWGVTDLLGNWLLPIAYDAVYELTDQLFIVEDNGLHGIVKQGNLIVVPLDYEFIMPHIDDDKVIAIKNGKWGVISLDNRVSVPFGYDSLSVASHGLYVAEKNGLYGIIDSNDDVLVPFAYHEISGISTSGYVVASNAEHCKGIINLDNKVVLPFHYYDVFLRADMAILTYQNPETKALTMGAYHISTGSYLACKYHSITSMCLGRDNVMKCRCIPVAGALPFTVRVDQPLV